MDRPKTALIIPAFNEAASIREVVVRSAGYGTPIVVDDASSDRTEELARAAGAEVVKHQRNLGYEGALETGFRRAAELDMEFAVTLDGDGQHDPQIIERFVAALCAGADVVVGIRDRRQRFAEDVFAWVGRRRWGIEDPLCGMKGYRMTVYRARGCFDSCSSVGTELAIFAAASGMKVAQLPVPTRVRSGSSRFGSGLKPNLRILRALAAVWARWKPR